MGTNVYNMRLSTSWYHNIMLVKIDGITGVPDCFAIQTSAGIS